MKIQEVFEDVKKVAQKYKLTFQRGTSDEMVYWVFALTDSIWLEELDNFAVELNERFGVEKYGIILSGEDKNYMGISFNLPYRRILTQQEIDGEFVVVEEEYLNYFPEPGQNFFVSDAESEDKYVASLDDLNRISLMQWFDYHPKVKPGNIVTLWTKGPGVPSFYEGYVIRLKT